CVVRQLGLVVLPIGEVIVEVAWIRGYDELHTGSGRLAVHLVGEEPQSVVVLAEIDQRPDDGVTRLGSQRRPPIPEWSESVGTLWVDALCVHDAFQHVLSQEIELPVCGEEQWQCFPWTIFTEERGPVLVLRERCGALPEVPRILGP